MNGHTNAMFALDTPVGGFALRLPKGGAAAGVDRRHERLAQRAAAAAGVGLPVLFFDEEDGTMLTRQEPDRVVREVAEIARDRAALAALGLLLRRLHATPVEFAWTFRAAEVVAAHLARIEPLPLGEPLQALAGRLDESVERRAPSHDDVHAANILWQDGRPRLIDWEYAGMNDPAFDLATARIELGLDADGLEALLDGYGRDDRFWRARVEDQATLALGIAGAWYLDQGNRLGDPGLVRQGWARLERCAARLG